MAALVVVSCVTINAREPARLAEFWSRLVGGTPVGTGNGYVLVDPGEGRTRLLFQQTDRPNLDPGWVHLDCSVEDREATAAEVEALGGRLVERRSDSNGSWIVLADPEGNPFCV
ncbi:VOC family protein [Cellulomonas composti]|nr:VOC family protein [Cellulomonas composti]